MDKKILIVGESSPALVSLQNSLSDFFHVEQVQSYDEAAIYFLTQYQLTKLVLICMDVFRLNHYSFISQMKTNIMLETIPVICIGNSYAHKSDREAEEIDAIEHGAIDYFTPPFSMKIIVSRINNYIQVKEGSSFPNPTLEQEINHYYAINKSSDSFWNEGKLDDLIMRTYVGAACILEAVDDRISVLRANKRFSTELLGRPTPVEKVLADRLKHFMDDTNFQLLMNTLNTASLDQEEAYCELCLHNLRADQPTTYVRLSVKLIETLKKRRLLYCTLENFTAHFEMQRKQLAMMTQSQIIMQNFSGGYTAAYNENHRYHFLYANDEFFQMFGFTRQQYEIELPHGLYDLILPEFCSQTKKALQSLTLASQPLKMEYQAAKRDHSLIWIRCHVSVCNLANVEAPVYVTVYQDITGEKRTLERINSVNDKWGSSEIFLHFDITNKCLFDYQSLHEPYKKISELGNVKTDFWDFVLSPIFEEDKSIIIRSLSFSSLEMQYTNGENKFSIEYRRHMLSGEIKWFCAVIILLDGITSNSIQAFVYCHDIDKRMKRRIARNKIIDTDVDDITILNIASGKSQILKYYQGISVELGVSLYSKNLKKFLRNEVAEEDKVRCKDLFSMETMLKAVSENGVHDFSFWIVTADGENRRKNAHVTYLDSSHEDLLLVGRDITELFEKEQQQQLALRHAVGLANTANRAKSSFLSSMSHDMRTPLTAILGLAELMEKEELSTVVADYLRNIVISGKYLLGLINDSLDLSKIESGKMEFHEEEFPLEEFILGIDTVIKPLMVAKNINFVTKLANQADNILVDKLRFNQVFFNLLSNAAKYTPEGGRVEFESKTIPAKEGKFGMRFFIRDTGIGMSKDYLHVLFEPFSQENRAIHTEQKGTGLGLAIVKRIIDLSGGTIAVHSEINKGTEFIVDLYAYNVAHPGPIAEAPKYDITKLNGIRILMVDDTEINLLIAEKILEEKGCLVETAINGLEAVNMFRDSKPGYYDIILTDVRMPVMDGLEETRQIRALPRKDASTIPIIGATADAYAENQDQTIVVGMNTRLVKPIKPDVLYQAIASLV